MLDDFGYQLTYFRKKKRLTQQNLADYLMVSRQIISKWELNESYPSLPMLVNLSEILEVTIDDLIGGVKKSMNKEKIISLKNIRKNYSNNTVIDNINLDINKHECIAIIGKNGAGKSTLLNIIMNYINPSSGKIITDLTRRDIGFLPQHTAFPNDIKVQEILDFHFNLYKNDADISKTNEILKFTVAQKKSFIKDLSGGQQRLLDFSLSIINNPKVLVIDEPTTGMDTSTRSHFWSFVNELKEEGTTVIFTTHYVDEINYCTDRIVLLNNGRVLDDDTPFNFRQKNSKKTVTFTKNYYEENINKMLVVERNIDTLEVIKKEEVISWEFDPLQTNLVLEFSLKQKLNLKTAEVTNSSLIDKIFKYENKDKLKNERIN